MDIDAPSDAAYSGFDGLAAADTSGAPIMAYDFGSGAIDQPRTATILVVNGTTAATGGLMLAIAGSMREFLLGNTTCGPSGILPGHACTVAITFRALAAGTRDAALTVTSASGAAFTLPLHGQGITGNLVFTPSSLDLGQAVGPSTTISSTITLVNNGATSASIDSTSVAAPFFVSATTCGASLPAGSSCDIAISFTPTQLGLASGDLSIASGSTQLAAPLSAHGARRMTVVRQGTAAGTVASLPAGIDCGATCAAAFESDVSLIATPDANQVVTSWTDASCGSSNTCGVLANSLQPVVLGVTFAVFAGGPDELQLTFAGDAPGQVEVYDSNQVVLATCTASCAVPYTPGHNLTVAGISQFTFDGFTGSCTTATGYARCSFLTPSGTSNVTATFTHDPEEQWTHLLADPVYAVAHDSTGNVIVGTSTELTKLSSTGATLWTIALPVYGVATGPGDTIYVVNPTSLVKLDASGTTLWTAGVEANLRPGPSGIAVAADGAVAVEGDSLTRWDSSGNQTWSNFMETNGYRAVAIDSQGVVSAAVDSVDTGCNTVRRFRSDGTEILPEWPELWGCNAAHVWLATDADGRLVASGNDLGWFVFSRMNTDGTIDYSYQANSSSGGSGWPGVAASSAGEIAWWYVDGRYDLASNHLSYIVHVFSDTGSPVWSLQRSIDPDDVPGFLAYGVTPNAASFHAGQLVLAGQYISFDTSTPVGLIQAFTP